MSDTKSMESVKTGNSESIGTTFDKESLIGRIFPEVSFNDDGSVKSGDSTTIDSEQVKVRISGMQPTITQEQEKELEDFLEAHKDELSFKSEDMNTQQLINEIQELLKKNPDAGPTGQGNASPTGQGDAVVPPPPPQQPESIKVPIYSDELIAAINNSNEQLNHDATKVELKEDGILVTVQNKPPAAQGGKSKKKQMKPKNKSNKKMKNKQTKKGGKQIKKRSLKRKMKK